MHVELGEATTSVIATAYRLELREGSPYARLLDVAGVHWTDLFLAGSAHATHGLDDTAAMAGPRVSEHDGRIRVTVEATSSAWAGRRLLLDCDELGVEARLELAGRGSLTDVWLLGGLASSHVRTGLGPHWSARRFRSVFAPEPTRTERRVVPASERAWIDVLGAGPAGRGDWFLTPAPLAFAASLAEAPGDGDPEVRTPGPWLAIGLLPVPGEATFTGFHYEGLDDGAFALRLAYEGETHVRGSWRSPAVRLEPGAPGPYAAVARMVAVREARGLVRVAPARSRPAWWREPIWCGWGEQCADPAGGSPFARCTQALYDASLARLAAAGVVPGTITIDDRWESCYGSGEPDTARWPDLRAWIAGRHAAGQRVLVWWKAWDPSAVPADQCVRNAAGIPVAVDPEHPAHRAHVRAVMARVLGPDGLDADGLKIDFTARTPSGAGMRHAGDRWGVELLHELLSVIADAARAAKADALLVTHTADPLFRDVTDMLRLNDIDIGAPVVPQMRHRARLAALACPDAFTDTDDAPMPDRATWRAYLAAKTDLGVPACYFASHVGEPPEPLTADDLEAVRRSWAAWRARPAA